MKVTFVSNRLTYHQLPFCEEMFKKLGSEFKFISTQPIEKDRINMYPNIEKYTHFVIEGYKKEQASIKQLVEDSDVVILGSASDSLIRDRLKKRKLTFKYSERLYKEGLSLKKLPRAFVSSWIHHGKFQKYPIYMLCASAYTAGDLNIFKNYKNRTFKWGYFPKSKEYDIEDLIKIKDNDVTEILWVGRLIDLKHVEHAIEVIKRLEKENYDFKLNIIGSGECLDDLKKIVKNYNLNKKVNFLGYMCPDEVRRYMERSNIYLFTSDFNEGWGAVLNESMNSGCAVIASHAIGSVPFLIKENENGLIYKYGDLDEFYKKLKLLMENKELQIKMGLNAYYTIRNIWSAENATDRLLQLIESLLYGKNISFDSGPCSKAEPIKEKDMYSYVKNNR